MEPYIQPRRTPNNARDQITNIRQSDNATGAYQDTTMGYDGYGRLISKHVPEQRDQNGNPTYTNWAYKQDDVLESISDGRGASATYIYNNNRHLVNEIQYSVPSGVTATPNATFGYDAAGNRISMTDGSGSMSYNYDQLSRLTSETRAFTGVGSYTLGYGYNLAGEVTSVTDQHAGTSFSTIYDNVGRVSSVSGIGYGGVVTPFASEMRYRAWGALKSMSYGNSTALSLGYNARGSVTNYSDAMVGTTYQYYDDGRVKFAHDQSYTPEAIKDRAFQYDHAGRIAEAYSGAQARDYVNNTNSGVADGPFRETYSYDAWDNLLNQNGRFWSRSQTTEASYNSNNRNTNWSYDNEGYVLSRNDGTTVFQAAHYAYDAAGLSASSSQHSSYFSAADGGSITQDVANDQGFDGDHRLVRAQKTRNIGVNGSLRSSSNTTSYELRSTALGGVVVSEYNQQGIWQRTYVYAGSQRIGQETKGETGAALSIWRHVDPVTGDELQTTSAATMVGASVLNSQGVDVGHNDPFPPDGSGDPDGIVVSQVSDKATPGLLAIEGGGAKCVLDGIEMDCGFVRGWSTQQCEDNDCGPRVGKDGHLTQPFQAFPDGWYGFLPQGAIYDGDGRWFISGGDRDDPHGKRRKIRPEDGNYGTHYNHATPQSTVDPCVGLVQFALRDESRDGAPTQYPFINAKVASEFNGALQEINAQVKGGIGFNEAFRTTDHQATLYAKHLKEQEAWDALPWYKKLGTGPVPAAQPGTSAHEAGFAVDVPLKYLTPVVLIAFARHGFLKDVADDPIHLQWTGWRELSSDQQGALIRDAQTTYVRCHTTPFRPRF